MGLFWNNSISVRCMQAMAKPQVSPTKERSYFMEKKENVGRGYFDPKSMGEQSVQVQGDSFSLAELQGWSVFVGNAVYIFPY